MFKTAQLELSQGLPDFPVLSYFRNLFTDSLLNLASFSNSALLPIKLFLSFGEPSYLFSMLSLAPKPRELRASGFHLLSVPRVKTHVVTRAFQLQSLLFRNRSLNKLTLQIAWFLSFVIWKHTFSDSLILPNFPFHLSIVDELFIVPRLWVSPTPVLGVPLS